MLFGVAQRRLTAAAIWILILIGAAYLFVFEPGRTGFFPVCPFRAITGLNCPGCGTARGLHQLVHGHFIIAFEYNPLTMIMLPFLGFMLIMYTRSAINAEPLPQFAIPPRLLWLFIFVIFGFWIIRNTPLYPFV